MRVVLSADRVREVMRLNLDFCSSSMPRLVDNVSIHFRLHGYIRSQRASDITGFSFGVSLVFGAIGWSD